MLEQWPIKPHSLTQTLIKCWVQWGESFFLHDAFTRVDVLPACCATCYSVDPPKKAPGRFWKWMTYMSPSGYLRQASSPIEPCDQPITSATHVLDGMPSPEPEQLFPPTPSVPAPESAELGATLGVLACIYEGLLAIITVCRCHANSRLGT